MNQRLLIALAMAATLAACSGGKSGKGDDGSQPIPTDTNAKPQPTSVVETERIDQGEWCRLATATRRDFRPTWPVAPSR